MKTQVHLAREDREAARRSAAKARLCFAVTAAVWGLQIAAAFWL